VAQTFYPITPTEIVAGAAEEWTPMNASALIPEGATGVILHVINNWSSYPIGLRKNGSTDDRYPVMYNDSHFGAMIGVDASRIFQAYVGDTSRQDIYVIGYTMSGVTFKTNADDKSLGTALAWTDIDCSTEAPSATGLIFETHGDGESEDFGFRKNGSSDDRFFVSRYHYNFSAVIGCDESQICEGYTEALHIEFFLLGYITDGVTFNLNATDLSLGTIDTWLDLPALPDENPVMGIIEVTMTVILKYGFRKDGSAEEIYEDGRYHPWTIVECADRIIEGKIQNTDVDFFLVGYAIEVVVGWTGKISGVTNPARVAGVAVANIKSVKGVE